MCGIVGILSEGKSGFWGTDLQIFEEMLVADAIRGKDSTGVFTVLSNSRVRVAKVATHPLNFIETPQWKTTRSMAEQTGHIMVGHNRKATAGSISRENAHPFYEDNIVLVHNGTIPNHKNDVGDTEVDSHAICKGFAKDGYEKTLTNLGGAWALVWYDLETKCLYAVRNDERPLCIVEGEKKVVISSEGYLGGWVMSRNHIKPDKMRVIDPRVVHKFEWIKGKLTITQEKLPEQKVHRFAHWLEPETPSEEIKRLQEDIERDVGIKPVTNLTATRPNEFQKWYQHYPQGSYVLFHPIKLLEPLEGFHRQRIQGQVYLPGKPIFHNAIALADVNMSEEDVCDMITEQTLSARVMAVSKPPHSDKLVMNLTAIKPETWVGLWGGREIPLLEWKYICTHELCQKCGSRLNMNLNKTTSVVDRPGKLRVVCHECVKKNLSKLPEEMRHEFEQASNPTL